MLEVWRKRRKRKKEIVHLKTHVPSRGDPG